MERRCFKRIPVKTLFSISRGSEIFMAETVNYSFNGLCLTVEGSSNIKQGDELDIVLETPAFQGKGRVVWTRPAKNGVVAGAMKTGMLFGSLKDFDLSDILIGLQRSGKTGMFHYLHGSIQKSVYIEGGDMIFASSNQPEDRLGDMLLAAGRITKEQYDKSVEYMMRTKKRQGASMVELEYMNPRELLLAVKEQVENIILSLFAFSEGNMIFKEGHLPTEEVITLRLSAANLIFRGIKRMQDIERIRELCPKADTVLVFASDPLDLFQDLRLEEDDKRILSCVDGRRTFKEIVNSCGGEVLDTMKTLYALMKTRMVTNAEEAEGAAGVEEEAVTADDILNAQGETPGADDEEETALEFVYRIEELYKSYNDLGYYGVLGVPETAGAAEIRGAYYRKAREFHPDRHFQLPDEMKEKLNSIFAYISMAFSTLGDGEMRRQYDEERLGRMKG